MPDSNNSIKRRIFRGLSAGATEELIVTAVIVGVISACAMAAHIAASVIEADKQAAVTEARLQATAAANLYIQTRLADAYRKGYATGQLYLCAHEPN